jgi:acyl-CoA thioesterase-1
VRGHSDRRISVQDAPLFAGILLAARRVSPLVVLGAVACLLVGGLASSGAVGARAAATGQARVSAAAPEPTPTLIDVLLAADALQKAGLLPGQSTAAFHAEPTPTLMDVLLAASALHKAGLLPGQSTAPLPAEPTLMDVLRAADALKQAGLLPSPTASGRLLEQTVPAPQDARTNVVFFGDSVTVGAGASDIGRGFVSILRDRLSAESRLGSSQVIISAFGGLHGDLENLPAVLQKRPGLVVVEVGAHSAVEDQATSIATFRSVYGLMLDCLQGSGAMVVVGTTPWLHWPSNGPTYARAAAISVVIGEEAAKRGIPVADIWDAMKDRESYVSSDGMHPNDGGHALIADLYRRQIQSQEMTPRYARVSSCGV